LNIGQPDIKTPEVAMNAVRNFDVKVLEYSHSAGFESYRSKLALLQIKDYPSMLKILLLQQVDQKLCFCNGSTMDPGDEIIIRTILRKLQWFFCCIWS
jgi:aspartate aminotransferase